MKRILLAFALCLAPSMVWAQCSGVFLNNTFCGNVTGASAPPRMTTLSTIPITSAQFDALFGTTQGSIIYRNATTWVPLTPGTVGQVLQSGGAAANPAWASAGAGTVTSVTQGDGIVLTPSPITTTGSVAIDPSTDAGLAAGTANKVVTAAVAVSAPNLIALTSAATVTPDLNSGYNFSLNQAHSFTLANPTNISGKEGRSFCIVVKNAAVAESMTFGSEYFAAGGTSSLSLTETNGALDMVCAFIYTASEVFVFLNKAFAH